MILYWVAWLALRLYFFAVLRLRVEGLEHLPRSGPCVLCSNHISWLDPLVLGVAAPRRLFYMTKAEVFASPAAALILRLVGAFPVRRHTADRRALRRAMELLQAGKAVALFPEGTRSRDGALGPAEPGAALLALWSGAEVVPVGIRGPYLPGRIALRFGPPFHLAPPQGGRPSRSELQRLAEDQIMGAVRALLPDGRRGSRGAIAVGRA
jgi:1-acyl-sn-glycerol-3-phosphate acyltransferase